MAQYVDSSSIMESLKNKDYNKLLRKLASDPAQFEMFQFVFDYRKELGVDLQAREKNRGLP